MLDFRYHALSLVAVFLALAIGIVLGVTLGDSLLSEAEQSLRENLRSDVVQAREDASDARQGVRARDEFIERVAPRLVEGRLAGQRVALVSWGELPEAVEEGVRDAVRRAGGRLDSISAFADPVADVRSLVGDQQFGELTAADALTSYAGRLASGIVDGGDLASDLRDLPGSRFRGRYAGASLIAFFHAPEEPTPDDPEEREAVEQKRELEDGLLEGLDAADVVVGVEASSTDPSQVGYFRGKRLTSVDSVDVAGGQVALVFALGGAEGAFGFKPGANEALPDLE